MSFAGYRYLTSLSSSQSIVPIPMNGSLTGRQGDKQMQHCYFCKGKVVSKRVRHIHEWGERVFIFKDVQADVCQQCGEVYFGPEALKRMDEVVLGNQPAATQLSVPVFSLAA
jgi:YgiT-type zinc finger domain-containing protein